MAFASDLTCAAAFKAEVLGTLGVLQVVECYTEWAGPCKAIVTTLKSLYFAYSDRPIKFYTVNTDKVQDKLLEPFKNKCQPTFLLYKDGVLKQTVIGVQGPALQQSIISLSDPAAAGA